MSLASLTDIADRKGRDLTTSETRQASLLITEADVAIADAAKVTVSALDGTANPVLRIIARDLVLRSMTNPDGVIATREQLGQYMVSQTYAKTDDGNSAGMCLTDRETLLVREAVHGTLTASPHAESLAEHLDLDLVTNRLTIYTDPVIQT